MKKALIFFLITVFCSLVSVQANAAWGIVDSLDISPFVPIILDAMMSVAMTGYEFFVGRGDGIIYLFVWGWLGWFISLYLIKNVHPTKLVGLFRNEGWSNVGQTICAENFRRCIKAMYSRGNCSRVVAANPAAIHYGNHS